MILIDAEKIPDKIQCSFIIVSSPIVLLYSTGNYIQYLVVNYNVKESEKDHIYI